MATKTPSRRMWTGCGCTILALLLAAVVFMSAGFGIAAYLDSERRVIASAVSPGGTWTAQIERLTVGGAPSTIVTVRRPWQPDWYLTSCKSVSYYGEAAAALRWESDTSVTVDVGNDPARWSAGGAPFSWEWPWSGSGGCGVRVNVR